MKENAKLFLVSIITIIISITGSAVANTMLQANSISYKTSNGDTTDVNSALDRLFDINTVNERLGNTDISSIGDGTITGAINNLIEVANNKIGFINTNDVIVSQTAIPIISGSNSYTKYTAERNSCVVINANITYGSSGYCSIKLNGNQIYYSTAYQNTTESILIGKGDILEITTNSSSTSYYTIYGLK